MIDNFELIKPFLEFKNENDFYFLQIIQRKKDHKDNNKKLGLNNNNRLIKAYYIYSFEQLEKKKDEIIALCELFNARAGIGINVRNSKDLSLEMLALLARNIKSNHFNQLGNLYNTICGQYHSDKDKKWILDIDDKSLETRHKVIKAVRECEPIGEQKIIGELPSKNGFHLISRPFNSQKFGELLPEVEIHKNNPTNLYIPDPNGE